MLRDQTYSYKVIQQTTQIYMNKKVKFLNWFKVLMFSGAVIALTSCNDDEPMGKGDVEFEITDAPSDDASIKGVFVTVADLKVDGKSVSGFTKQTIDLKAYQEGKTKLLGATQLNSRTYSNLTMVLDLNQDANGNAPGCYVLNSENVKFKLRESDTGKAEITLTKSWNIKANTKTNIVLDFDLRKSIKYVDDVAVKYNFVSDNSLKAAVRVVAKQNTGAINGTYQEQESTNADMIVVYAYKKGTFNASTETQGTETENVQFRNSVTSAVVKESLGVKSYTLALLEEGEYELHFASYVKNSETGRFSFNSRLQSQTSASGSIADVFKVNAGASLTVSSSVTGIF
jgi:hypothetical protein